MFGKFKKRFVNTLKSSSNNNNKTPPSVKIPAKDKQDIMAALSSPMKNNNNNNTTNDEIDGQAKDRLFTSRRARGSFTLDDNEVKTGDIGETLRSEKEILLQFDAEYFDPNVVMLLKKH